MVGLAALGPPYISAIEAIRVASMSRGFDEFVDRAALLNPLPITPFGVFGNVAQHLDGFGLIARLAGIVGRNDHFDLDGHHESVALDEARSSDSLSLDSHD